MGRYVVGDRIVWEGEALRELGIEPSTVPVPRVEGRVTSVDRAGRAITVSFPTDRRAWRGVEGMP